MSDAPRPYYSSGGIDLYLGDCYAIMPALAWDAVVSDPPYGMAWPADSRRFSGGYFGAEGRAKRGAGRQWGAIIGDDQPFDPSPFLDAPNVVLWGMHHFARRLPVGTVLVWIKRADDLFGTFLSDAELAWRKGGHGVYCHRKQFPPPSRGAEAFGEPAHPTQKPLSLMRWSIERSGAPAGARILDPFAGSGTTLVAAKELGRRAVGIEIDERYAEIAARRLEACSVLPFTESHPEPMTEKQESFE